MPVVLTVLFFLSLFALVHTYLLYPLLLRFWCRNKQPNTLYFSEGDLWPLVSVICSVYNEEAVIVEKLESLLASDYPAGRLHIYLGSDCSQDATNQLVEAYAKKHSQVHFFPFPVRRGKPTVVNDLVKRANTEHGVSAQHVLLLTDANVMLAPSTLRRLVRHFKRPGLALVDAHMRHTGMRKDGISRAENQYISGEVLLKHREGMLWQKMMGPFGGCYALRSDYYSPVPPRFLVDDFFIALSALERGGGAINDLEAVCYEAVSHDMQEEYRRKRRISAGNFQNMVTFSQLWWPPVRPLAFAFFSHKVLRWLGPFFLAALYLIPAILGLLSNIVFGWLFMILAGGSALAVIADQVTRKIGWNILPLRGISYFLFMNMALLEGFFKYVKGIKSNVWQPTKRNH